MRRLTGRIWLATTLLCCSQQACVTDSMPPDIYASTAPFPVDGAPPLGANDASVIDTDAQTNEPFGEQPPDPACDVSGPWLITERLVATGLGAQQAAVYWLYYEIEQSGAQLRVKKGLVCGTQVQPIGAVSATVNMSGAWAKLMELNPHAGRTGSARPAASGCSVTMARMPYVMGASMPYYRDENVRLPSVDQAAAGAAPGWEDWDADGKPAVSLRVSGIANGTRFAVTRTTCDWSGEIDPAAQTFKLRSNWKQEESVMGATAEILKSTGSRDADARLHFAQLAKLMPNQVSGSDSALCEQIRKLAPTLTAEANK